MVGYDQAVKVGGSEEKWSAFQHHPLILSFGLLPCQVVRRFCRKHWCSSASKLLISLIGNYQNPTLSKQWPKMDTEGANVSSEG